MNVDLGQDRSSREHAFVDGFETRNERADRPACNAEVRQYAQTEASLLRQRIAQYVARRGSVWEQACGDCRERHVRRDRVGNVSGIDERLSNQWGQSQVFHGSRNLGKVHNVGRGHRTLARREPCDLSQRRQRSVGIAVALRERLASASMITAAHFQGSSCASDSLIAVMASHSSTW